MADLQARNAELAEALAQAEAARAVAMGAAEAKDRFFANLTHEIRTPLNGIASTAELLAHTELDAEQRPLADALGASTANLVLLVNAMLDHARLRAGRVSIDLTPIEVRRAAANLEHLFLAQATDKGLDFAVTVADDVPAWIEVDAIKVRQILGNLTSNAIKFTARGSVKVTVGQAPPDAAHPSPRLVLRVTDTGAGIAPDQLDPIFEPFVQGDASISRTHGGTGLGLAIARQLASVLGGTLTVRSRQGEGSEFTLTVPFRVIDAPVEAAAPPEPIVPPAAGLRVLLAEDNEINRTVASRMLDLLDADVVVAEDGARAVGIATTSAVDLVLMDLQMPGLDGIEAARIIRSHERERDLPAVPIVAMTGNDPDDYGVACADAGMDGFLMKPVGMDDLRSLLASIAAAKGPEGRLAAAEAPAV
jgi:CheY-like chemotaxis protein